MKKTFVSVVSSAIAFASLVGCTPLSNGSPVNYTPVPCDPGEGKRSKCVGVNDPSVTTPAAAMGIPAVRTDSNY